MKRPLSLSLLLLLSIACAPQSTQKTTLEFWGDINPKESQFFKHIFEAYQKKHPEIQIKTRFLKFRDLKPSFLGAQKPPDVLLLMNDWLGELVQGQHLKPLPFAPDQAIAPHFKQALSYKNTLYALPLVYQVSALYYNKDLVPAPPQTLAELTQYAKAVQAKGHYGFMYDVQNFYYHGAFFHGFGGHLLNAQNQLALTAAPLEKSLQWRNQLIASGLLSDKASYATMVNLFASGELGMMLAGNWTLRDLPAKGLNFGVSPLPAVSPNANPRPFLGVKGLAISSRSAHPKAATALLRYLSSEEVQRKILLDLDNLPVMSTVYTHTSASVKAAFFAQKGVPMPNHAKMNVVWQEMNWLMGQTLPPQQAISPLVQKVLNNIESAP